MSEIHTSLNVQCTLMSQIWVQLESSKIWFSNRNHITESELFTPDAKLDCVHHTQLFCFIENNKEKPVRILASWDYSGMQKSKLVRISDRPKSFGTNLVRTTKMSEIPMILFRYRTKICVRNRNYICSNVRTDSLS